jgi:hypothetical protein
LFLIFVIDLTDYAIAYVATLAMPGSDVATVFIAILVAQAVSLTWNKEVSDAV